MNERATIRQFFDTVVRTSRYEDRYVRRTSVNAYEILKRKDVVLDCLAHLGVRQGKILDVGCGPAVYAPELAAQGFDVWGVDLAPNVIEQAKAVMAATPHADRTHFAVGDIDHLDFPDGTFDAALAVGLLEYLPSDAAVLREFRRVLKPGAIAVITLQNRYSYYTAVRGALRPLRPILRAIMGRRLAGRQLLGPYWSRSHAVRAFERTAAEVGMPPVTRDFVNFNPLPFNLPWHLPRAYFRLLDQFNDRPGLRRRLPWLCGTYVVALRRDGARRA